MSAAIVGGFWFLVLARVVWNVCFCFPGAGFALIAALVLSVILSGVAGLAGSPRWYLIAAAAAGSLMFIGLRMH
jgi:hypothetical protein